MTNHTDRGMGTPVGRCEAEDTLFAVLTTHCFYGCGFITKDVSATSSSDAMEQHYWDVHYSQETRDWLRAKGQLKERIGAKP